MNPSNPFVFTDTEMLLLREASLASMCIGNGLTDIGKYNFAAKGYFYSALFSFTIGIERVSKLILIYDYLLQNSSKFPDNNYVKRYSHNLSSLLIKAEQIHDSYGLNIREKKIIDSDSLLKVIIDFLTNFAKSSRYYNLDEITGTQSLSDEPLKKWEEEVNIEILRRHYRKPRQIVNESLLAKLNTGFSIVHIGNDGKMIRDLSAFVNEGSKIDTKNKYAKFYLYQISSFLCQILTELEYKGNFFPNLREFFYIFTNQDRSYVLKRKTWNPNKP